MKAVVTTEAINHAKLQSNHHHQQTNIQFFTGRMPLLSPNQQCQSTEGKISHSMGLLTPSSAGGLPTLSLSTNRSWLPWGRVAMPLISLLVPVPLSSCLTIVNFMYISSTKYYFCFVLPAHCSRSGPPQVWQRRSVGMLHQNMLTGHMTFLSLNQQHQSMQKDNFVQVTRSADTITKCRCCCERKIFLVQH